MPCYVDTPVRHGRIPGGGRATSWCHLIADTEEELHAMAERIGMKRAWFQASPPASFPHYDLTAARRQAAVALGAVECDYRALAGHLRRIRSARVLLAAEQPVQGETEESARDRDPGADGDLLAGGGGGSALG